VFFGFGGPYTIKNNRCDIILDYIHTTGKTTRKTIGTKINRLKYLIINPSGILLNSHFFGFGGP
jgi:hypothetical protein